VYEPLKSILKYYRDAVYRIQKIRYFDLAHHYDFSLRGPDANCLHSDGVVMKW